MGAIRMLDQGVIRKVLKIPHFCAVFFYLSTSRLLKIYTPNGAIL